MANPELGTKQICPNCQAKFYDLSKRPAHCPKCDTEFDPELAPARLGEVQRSAIDPSLAGRVLGWAPAHDLATGLGLTAESFR